MKGENMKNVIKNSLLVFALSIISILSFPNVAYAFETYAIDTDEMKELIDRGLKKGDEIENSHVFAMPDNGWNIVTVGLNYLESYYEKNSTQNIFSFREKIYTEKRSGVGSGSIKLEVSNVLHTDGSNNVIISEFELGDIMYDPNKWDHGSHYYNTTKKTYAKNTKYDGQVTYLLTCPDAIHASAAESARISLATN